MYIFEHARIYFTVSFLFRELWSSGQMSQVLFPRSEKYDLESLIQLECHYTECSDYHRESYSLHLPHLLSPWYFLSFSCFFFLMLLSLSVAISITMAVLICLYTATVSGYPSPVCLSVPGSP